MAAAVLALAGCSGSDSGGGDEKPTGTASVSPTLDAAAQREACVTAWAKAIQAGQDDIDQEPDACTGLPGDDRMDRFVEGMQQRNKANREGAAECLEDPTCTSLPIP